MKAILVIDMPEDCWDCHLPDELVNCKGKPFRCPLKPMPEPKPIKQEINGEDYYIGFYGQGWNDCIKEIEK